MGAPIPDGIDLRRTFRSKHLEGLFGIRPHYAEHDWMNGAALLASALELMTIHVNQHQVAEGTETAKATGTPWRGILKYAGKHRVHATITKETPATGILMEMRAGRPVLLEWGDWISHWVMMVGWEAPTETLVLMDATRSPERGAFVGYPWKQFLDRWEGMQSPCPRVAVVLQKASETVKSGKGLEDRSDFRLATWAYVHRSHK